MRRPRDQQRHGETTRPGLGGLWVVEHFTVTHGKIVGLRQSREMATVRAGGLAAWPCRHSHRSRAAGDLSPVESALAITGKGLRGDRHFHPDGTEPGAGLTLVDEKEVRAVGPPVGGTRRQLTVRGADLETLIGERFRAGVVECYEVRICQPCLHFQKMTRPGILRQLVHRAGINADILSTGRISLGDRVVQTHPRRHKMSTPAGSEMDYAREIAFDALADRVFDALRRSRGPRPQVSPRRLDPTPGLL